LASLVRSGRLVAAAGFLRRAGRQPRLGGVGRIVTKGGLLVPNALYEPARRLFAEPLMPPWLNERWFAERGVRPAAPDERRRRDALRAELEHHLTTKKLPRLLRYADRSSMAHSIESRVPFLTPALAQFILSLPEPYVIAPDGTSKAVFRRAMAGVVPPAVLERRDKIGFQTPLSAWMRILRLQVGRILDGAEDGRVPPLALGQVRAEWSAWLERRGALDAHRFWLFVNVIRWADRLDVTFEDGA
jgi:asparagine synthase (glutamine-hydrolysing)